MTEVRSQNPAYFIASLLEKMNSNDKDFRFMATSDLINEISKNNIKIDEDSERKIVRMMLKLLNDKNMEVQNLAIKCVGVLAPRIKETNCDSIVDVLCENVESTDETLRDVSTICLRTFVGELPPGSTGNSLRVANRLLPRLNNILKTNAESASKAEVLDIVGEVLLRNGISLAPFHKDTEEMLLLQLATTRPAVKKRAIGALGHFALVCSLDIFKDVVEKLLASLEGTSQHGDQKTLVTAIATLVKNSPSKFAQFIPRVVPNLLKCLHKDDDEMKEAAIQALECSFIRCPRECGDFYKQIEDELRTALCHDPNYSYEADEDEMETDEEEQDDDEDYSDDDDLSWKVRRASAKALEGLIVSRREHLPYLIENIGALLIDRMKEREENVRGDVFNAYGELLKQVKGFVPNPQSATLSREQTQVLDALSAQLPLLLRTITKLLKGKNNSTRQFCFSLLTQIVKTLPGSLTQWLPSLLDSVCVCLGDSSVKPQMRMEVLSFLDRAFSTHSPDAFHAHADQLATQIAKAIGDVFYKVSSEALVVSSSFVPVLSTLPPSTATPLVDRLYSAIFAKLKATDIDQEVRERAISSMGVVLAAFCPLLSSHLNECLSLLVDRVRNEMTRLSAVKALDVIGRSGQTMDSLADHLPTLIPLLTEMLRKNQRALKISTLTLLLCLLEKFPQSFLSEKSSFIQELTPLINDSDLQISQLALRCLTVSIECIPPRVGEHLPLILTAIVQLTQSTLLQGAALTALLDLLSSLMRHPVPGRPRFEDLLDQLSAPVYECSALPRQCSQSVSACTAVVAASSQDSDDAVKLSRRLTEQLHNKGSTDGIRLFALLTLGELGRRSPSLFLKANIKPEEIISDALNSQNEDLKSAAAHSLGGIAVGNLSVYLPFILEQVNSQPKRQYLLLHALKEVIMSETQREAAPAFLEQVPAIWKVLIKHADTTEEGTRCVISECLGKLCHVNPPELLPMLKTYVTSPSVNMRAAVVTSVKFMISDEKRPIDVVLQPMIGDFLSTVSDENLDVRRVALVVLNSAAHNKPELIRGHLASVLPIIYLETKQRPELVREVEMGPFKHTVDDGLDLRKSAFECMYTLLDSCLDLLELNDFISCVESGLKDHHDIRLLSYMTLNKLAVLCPSQLIHRIDRICEPLKLQLNTKAKANSVKQEQDKAEELKRAVLRTVLTLQKMADSERQQQLTELMQMIRHNAELTVLLASVEKDAQRGYAGEPMDTA